jgi:hypothetical protein
MATAVNRTTQGPSFDAFVAMRQARFESRVLLLEGVARDKRPPQPNGTDEKPAQVPKPVTPKTERPDGSKYVPPKQEELLHGWHGRTVDA